LKRLRFCKDRPSGWMGKKPGPGFSAPVQILDMAAGGF